MKKFEGWVTAPQGFIAAGVKAGIKASGNHDVAVIFSTVPAACGAVFTQNKMCAAPVLVSREVNKHGYAQAIAVNSGCANACTGEQGLADAKKMQSHTAELLGIAPEAVFVCSTGVIGQFLPMDKLLTGIADAVDSLDECEGESCAMAIQTTDTFIKHAAYETEIGGKKVTFAGIAKGAGMIHPNMATTLNFITSDVAISSELIQKALSEIVKVTYNCLSIDGDTSTNDMVSIMANGLAGNTPITTENDDYQIFKDALYEVLSNLTRMLAKDGEGASKLLECTCAGAPDLDTAIIVAKSVIRSPLLKCAMFGEDANWGRILCAIGYAEADFDIDKVELHLRSTAGSIKVCENGAGVDFSEEEAAKILHEDEIYIDIDLHQGDVSAKAWGCDLTYDYVKINGDYRS